MFNKNTEDTQISETDGSIENYEQVFTVAQPAKLTVQNVRGKVTVRAGQPGSIRVRVSKYLHSGSAENTLVSLTQQDDGSVLAKCSGPEKIGFYLLGAQPCRVDFDIETPPDCSVELQTVSAAAQLHGLTGEFHLNTVSGALQLGELTGKLAAKTVSGKIYGEQLAGRGKVESVSGAVELRGTQFDELACKTVSGQILAETSLAEGPYSLDSVSGKVRLIIPPDSSCTVRARSVSGNFKTSLHASAYHRHGGRSNVEINGGGASIRFKSVSGNLYLLGNENDHASAPHVHRKTTEERLQILDQVGSGEMSVDEAMLKLA
ncbi:MAG: DUF4097 domain-containing protein [Anaerolineae bacterium]|nr:DUF4097 domain-containing protein [Anaerolineae bacterium]